MLEGKRFSNREPNQSASSSGVQGNNSYHKKRNSHTSRIYDVIIKVNACEEYSTLFKRTDYSELARIVYHEVLKSGYEFGAALDQNRFATKGKEYSVCHLVINKVYEVEVALCQN